MAKVLRTLRDNWKKSIFFSGCLLYASKYVMKWHKEDVLMREYCLRAREFGRQTITAAQRPRKVVVFLNPAAKDGKTKYLLEKHVLPMLHLAGLEIHVVRTEHEGQAKAYMGVLDNSIVDAVVVAGGDGTLSEIVTGLLRREDDIAKRIPIGVLPFGQTNTFASRLFPPQELEVERYCQASMAIITNKFKMADVIEVEPDRSSEMAEVEDKEASAGNKNIYLLSDLKWGVHSDVVRRRGKYWYMPGPLKTYYCYMKEVLSGHWPPHVEADLELCPPCEGCRRCVTAAPVEAGPPKPAKSVWWWPTDNRVKKPATPADPRLERENPACGEMSSISISTPQLYVKSVSAVSSAGLNNSHMELSVAPETSKIDLVTKQSASEREHHHISHVSIKPKSTQPCYIMDSEKFEVVPAKLTLLKDKIKVFTS